MAEKSRGVVVIYEDLCDRWINWMKDSHLTTLGVHKICRPGDDSIGRLMKQLDAPGGRAVIGKLEDAGITVEYELHSLEWLLPRELFKTEPELFRVNDRGERACDCNLCPSSERALAIVSENAYKLAKLLGQSSHNYYFWLDDIENSVCHCQKCAAAGYSPSDQNMLTVNAIAAGVKAYDPQARAAYLAYADAKQLPRIKPADNVFLEFAPMNRDHNKPINSPDEERSVRYVKLLDELLTVFRPGETHILEYWLDDAMFSGYKMPPVKVPFNAAVADADTKFYASRGIANVKTFASYIGEEYARLHGDPPIKKYGEILEKYITI